MIEKVVRALQDIRLKTYLGFYFLAKGEVKRVRFKNQKVFDELIGLNYFIEAGEDEKISNDNPVMSPEVDKQKFPCFKIIITCCNVEKWIGYSLESLLRQTYKNWTGIIIDDYSIDNTCNVINDLIRDSDKITLVRNKQQLYKMQNLVNAINITHPSNEDILVFLDGDDWLPNANVLSYLASVYKNSIWITWGSFVKVDGKDSVAFNDYGKLPISEFTRPAPLDWNIRKSWRYSHLKTCKYFLWKNIKDKSLREKSSGKYYSGADDLAFMFPMIEMAGPDHSKYIDRVMYIYNNGNPKSIKRTILKKQVQESGIIQKKYRYAQKTKSQLITPASEKL